MVDLVVSNITVLVDDNKLVDNVSFCVAPGELVVMLGPNGAGKSSLIRAILGLQRSVTGDVALGDQHVFELDTMSRARKISYLPQSRPLAWPNQVRDVVALGRFSHGVSLGRLRDEDLAAVDRAMNACDIAHLAERRTDTLSGGELARVHCARAFAAEAPIWVADEPIAALDPRHQFRIMDLIKAYVEKGASALVVLHDIQFAAKYASRLLWMKDGRLIADGPPQDTLTAEQLHSVYGVNARVDDLHITMEGAL